MNNSEKTTRRLTTRYVSVVGGMDRLAHHYQRVAGNLGISLQVFRRAQPGMAQKLQASQAVVLFTGHISHQARELVMGVGRSCHIPVLQCHSSGLSSFRRCLHQLADSTSPLPSHS